MQLSLDRFVGAIPKKQQINEQIAASVQIKGLENVPELVTILGDIFAIYEFENNILRLRDEQCNTCKSKLKRKGIYEKEISMPGGATLLLRFHQYSCTKCKVKIDRKLGSWFTPKERYSSNVKADAIRLYLTHLSSFDAVCSELNKTYGKRICKRSVRRWLTKCAKIAHADLKSETNFSGHFVYDEEYLKVYLGGVGVKGAKLERIQVYLLLFRDAVTKKVLLMLSHSLDKSVLIEHWRSFFTWTIKQGLPLLTFTTDGKREYDVMIRELNQEFPLKVQHAYCIFHFKKNLYEVANEACFGVIQTKRELPLHVKNQIQDIQAVVDQPSHELFLEKLAILEHQIQTFIPALRKQIQRLRTYQKNYTLHKEFPFLRTTNTCEHWFGETKPEKVKKGYKTQTGVMNLLQALAVKKTHYSWQYALQLPRDIQDATQLLISTLLHKPMAVWLA